jgi:hypothetical protein
MSDITREQIEAIAASCQPIVGNFPPLRWRADIGQVWLALDGLVGDVPATQLAFRYNRVAPFREFVGLSDPQTVLALCRLALQQLDKETQP